MPNTRRTAPRRSRMKSSWRSLPPMRAADLGLGLRFAGGRRALGARGGALAGEDQVALLEPLAGAERGVELGEHRVHVGQAVLFAVLGHLVEDGVELRGHLLARLARQRRAAAGE